MDAPTLGGWLVHVMRSADGTLSLEESLHVIMDSMKEYFPCQSVAVILVDEDTDALSIKISRQISYTFIKEFRRASPSPIAEKVILEQRPLLLNDLDPQSDTYRQLKLEHDFVSAVLAPVIRNQRGVGYVFCDRANHEHFDETDLLHLQVIGYVIGSLMEKFDLIRLSKKLSSVDDASKALQYKAFVPAAGRELQRARAHEYPVAFALIEVDAFRRYVDTHGINEAHRLLADVVQAIRPRIRDTDILARFSADEFILCLSGTTEEEACALLETIRRDVAEGPLVRSDAPVNLTISAVALKTGQELRRSLHDILAALGKSLMRAKTAGDGHVALGAVEPAVDEQT
jgi:diguanylate cyclase (GGDEF)-like protein